MAKLIVRVVSPWFGELETEEASFSVGHAAASADALLCDWAPSEELFTFSRRKAWYCCEPLAQFKYLQGGSWPEIRDRLGSSEFLSHRHPLPQYRVPHITHFEELSVVSRTDRINRAVAVVSNFGGGPWRRNRDMAYRNRFIINPLVDLYGRGGWREYRSSLLSAPAAPSNYKGEISGDWPAAEKRELISRYKVSVCMENVNEPHYFTEKFVESVCAGCIPIYRPDDYSAADVLSGAFWVDPRDHNDDPDKTLKAALALDSRQVQEQNRQWLAENAALRRSSHLEVFRRIGRILSGAEDVSASQPSRQQPVQHSQ
jgi:hypothetical protein